MVGVKISCNPAGAQGHKGMVALLQGLSDSASCRNNFKVPRSKSGALLQALKSCSHLHLGSELVLTVHVNRKVQARMFCLRASCMLHAYDVKCLPVLYGTLHSAPSVPQPRKFVPQTPILQPSHKRPPGTQTGSRTVALALLQLRTRFQAT